MAPASVQFSSDGEELIVNDMLYESRWPLNPSPHPFIPLTAGMLAVLVLGFRTSWLSAENTDTLSD